MKEKIPRWLINQRGGKPKSNILEHTLNEGHACDRESGFKILYNARYRGLLKYIEAAAIKRLKPELNVQFDLAFRLRLWS